MSPISFGMSEYEPTVLGAFVILLGPVLSGIGIRISTQARNHARNADGAVNHRAAGEPRLVELVDEISKRVINIDDRITLMSSVFNSRANAIENHIIDLSKRIDGVEKRI